MVECGGPKAPKDPEMQGSSFYIMRNKEIAGAPQPDGRGIQYLYLDGGRLEGSARMVGGISDEKMLASADEFRKLVRGIGVRVEIENRRVNSPALTVNFVFQMHGKSDPYNSGTVYSMRVRTDGVEQFLNLDAGEESVSMRVRSASGISRTKCGMPPGEGESDDRPGQIRFEFDAPDECEMEMDSGKGGAQIHPSHLAKTSVRFFLRDGFEAPEMSPEEEPDFDAAYYREMLKKSLIQTGDVMRLKATIEKAKRGGDVTIAFIGGSITQGAGAVPIHTGCYAYRTFEGLCALAGKGTDENLHYIKAGVGGTPSELGMLRYERDVLRDGDGEAAPDIVVVEFAVNDEGDETKGECYDALVRKALCGPNEPAVILLFAVFANDWNLQERLSPIGRAYNLPMVSIKDCVVEQFYKKSGEGRVVSKSQFFYDSLHPSNIGHKIMADALIHLFETAEQMPEDAPPMEGEAAHLDGAVEKLGNSVQADCSLRLALRENPCEFQNVKLLDRRTITRGKVHMEGAVEVPPHSGRRISRPKGEDARAPQSEIGGISRRGQNAPSMVKNAAHLDGAIVKNEPDFENGSEIGDLAVISCGSFFDTDTDLQMVEMDCNLTPTPQFPYNWSYRGKVDGAVEVPPHFVQRQNAPSIDKNAAHLDGAVGYCEPFRMTITCTSLLLIYKDSGSANAGCAEVYVDQELVLTADSRVNGWTHCNPVICFRGRERKAWQVEIRMRPGDEDKDFTILGFGYVE